MALKHAQSGEVVHLWPKAAEWATLKTSALVKSEGFEAIRLILRKDEHIPSHKVDGFLTLFCLEGHVLLEANGSIELRPGDWIYLDRGALHDLRAFADSALLLHIMFDR